MQLSKTHQRVVRVQQSLKQESRPRSHDEDQRTEQVERELVVDAAAVVVELAGIEAEEEESVEEIDLAVAASWT